MVYICKDGRPRGRNNSYHKPEYKEKMRKLHEGKAKGSGKYVWQNVGRGSTRKKTGWNPKSIGRRFEKGEKHYNWQGGVTKYNKNIRCRPEYKQWRKSVFERDNYTCVICGKIGGQINAHHIKSFKEYPELRFEISNGITLCSDCHYIKIHKQKRKKIQGEQLWLELHGLR